MVRLFTKDEFEIWSQFKGWIGYDPVMSDRDTICFKIDVRKYSPEEDNKLRQIQLFLKEVEVRDLLDEIRRWYKEKRGEEL